jgi:hypothetical protein
MARASGSAAAEQPVFDPSAYVRPPVFDVATGVGLAIGLLRAMAPGAPPSIKAAARKVRHSCVALQTEWQRALDATPPLPDKKLADHELDVAWAVVEARVAALAQLPHDRYPRAARAAALHARLFAEGLGFLNRDYEAEYAHSQRLLDVIRKDNLQAEIDDLCGPECLAEVQRTHASYDAALHPGHIESRLPVKLRAARRELATSIATYALKVAAGADLENEAEVSAVVAALRPIDELRARQARRGGAVTSSDGGTAGSTDGPAPTPATPVPEVHT